MDAPTPRRPRAIALGLLKHEASGGLVLMLSAVSALAVANSPLAPAYFAALHVSVGPLSVGHWINDAMMALFFLGVGLEIKRECGEGRLRTWPDRLLPGLAALGGMIAPALVYVALNRHAPDGLRGWAIPAATDIAFALGVLALLGSRVPPSLVVFLTALAIIDDLGAVLIIAAFYTADLSWPMLGGAALVTAMLAALNRAGVVRLVPYALLGLALWGFVFASGLHATLAGVVLAITIPLRGHPHRAEGATSPLHRLEHGLAPWTAFLVLPLFGFANAGVSLAGLDGETLVAPVTLGVALGLFLGKQIGVFGAALVAIRLGLARRPAGASWGQLYGLSMLCGVGFTMSLFIGLLAFAERADLQAQTKVGVLLGSFASMAFGAAVLWLGGAASRRDDPPRHPG